MIVLVHDVQSNEVISNTELLLTLLNVTLTRSCKLCIEIFSYKFTSLPK